MPARYVLTEYVEEALGQAAYEPLPDSTFAGSIPSCPGVIAFAESREACADELRSVLEDWILVGLKLGHHLPVIAGIDLNREPAREPVDAV